MPNKVRRTAIILCLSLLVGASGYLLVRYYSLIFSVKVSGEIVGVERVTQPEALVATGRTIPTEQLFSFAVAIKDSNRKEIMTASSEDRQWAVAKVGQCAEARYFPYAPWLLEKAGTYFGARLLKLFDCPKQ